MTTSTGGPSRTDGLWDLAIVGAGPAGSAAALGALAARPATRVVLLDRADFPRDKACGDGIAPHVLDVLAEVGVSGLLDDWMPVRRLHLRHQDASVDRSMRRPAYVVPRTVFDSRLLDAAVQAGAVLRRHRVRRLRAGSDRLIIDDVAEAKVVIGADGAYSAVRNALGWPASGRRALALRGYAPTPSDRAGQQVIAFAGGQQPAYAWSFDRGDGVSNVGYGELLTSRRPPPGRRYILQRLEHLLPGSVRDAGDWLGHHLPLSSWRWRHPTGRVLLAGDAVGLINPLTGEGIYHAVATGVSAGQVAVAALGENDAAGAGTQYRDSVRCMLGWHLRHTTAAARLVSLPGMAGAGVRAAGHEQRVFDDLVELGLGRGTLPPSTVAAVLAARVGSLAPSPRSP